jgi:two-component system nitrogen regulation response regulator GlnG
VIAATHRDLRAMVRAGRFREDLYYRLAVVATQVPPLRERKDDIPALITCFAERMGRGAFAQSPALLEQLLRHDWPGNVRELRNVVERALSLGNAALADLGDPAAPPHPATAPGDGAPLDDGAGRPPTSPPGASTATSGDVLDLPFKEAKAALVEGFERDYLTALLARHRGNISRAASEAGIDRNYVHRLVKKYGLEVDRG